ncbi:DUF551 domain-containing protein [bacterium]|nr:DUF551 domain-containing protein [bacterium]
MEWVKCSKRIPVLGDYSVLVYFSDTGSIETVHVEDYFKDITCGIDALGVLYYTKWYKNQNVTHWMELPEEPKED